MKKNVPDIRFKGFEDEWENISTNNLFQTYCDKNHPELPVLSATQQFGMIIRDNTGLTVQHDKENEKTYKHVLPGHFVIHLRSFQGGFAHSAIEGITSPAYTIFEFRNKANNNDLFWKYVLSSKEFIKRLETVTYGIRDGRNINFQDFSELWFYVPNVEEQKKIATFFTTLDNLISKLEQKLEKQRNIKQALLQKMFVDLNGDNFAPLIRLKGYEGDWKKVSLGTCFLERSERSGNGELISVTINSGVVKASDLDRIDNSSSDKSHYKKVEIGDIAYNSMRMWQGACGYSKYSGICSPAYTVVIPAENINVVFFSYMFKRDDILYLFRVNSQGLTSDTWNLKYPAFSKINCYVTDIEEQKRIVSLFTTLDNLNIKLEQKIEKLRNIKQALLRKMFVQQ